MKIFLLCWVILLTIFLGFEEVRINDINPQIRSLVITTTADEASFTEQGKDISRITNDAIYLKKSQDNIDYRIDVLTELMRKIN